MSRAEVDDLEAVSLLCVGNDRKTITAPDLVLRRLFGILDLRLKFRSVIPVELTADRSLGDLARNPLPSERQLNLVAQVSARLLETPDERSRIKPRRLSALARPLGNLRA